jgi:hypothetical protein
VILIDKSAAAKQPQATVFTVDVRLGIFHKQNATVRKFFHGIGACRK